MEEIEVKFLDINILSLEEKLKSLGAKKIGDFLYKRKSYDFSDKRLEKENAWVRLRDEGDRVTMAFKQRLGVSIHSGKDQGMKEIEIIVSDFNLADQFLYAIGLKEKFYEENKRLRYVLNNVVLDIDTWPMLNPYLEIEGPSWEKVEDMAKTLGLNWEDHVRCSTMQIYDMAGINENDYSVITFEKQIKK